MIALDYISTQLQKTSTETIDILYHTDKIDPIEQKEGSDWIDLRTAEDVTLEKDTFTLINLGVSMKIPSGYEAHLVVRSSTFKNYGIIQTNSVGIIDESYCGNEDVWKLPVYATKDIFIPHNTRICQFRIVPKQPTIVFNKVNDLGMPSRGGFGSTGKS